MLRWWSLMVVGWLVERGMKSSTCRRQSLCERVRPPPLWLSPVAGDAPSRSDDEVLPLPAWRLIHPAADAAAAAAVSWLQAAGSRSHRRHDDCAVRTASTSSPWCSCEPTNDPYSAHIYHHQHQQQHYHYDYLYCSHLQQNHQ